jgi:hypothetical protein
MPASGHQDHTTLPSALALFVKSAFASTASTPDVRDDRETPLFRVGQPTHADDLRAKESGKFLRKGLDRFLLICPSGNQAGALIAWRVNSPWSMFTLR